MIYHSPLSILLKEFSEFGQGESDSLMDHHFLKFTPD